MLFPNNNLNQEDRYHQPLEIFNEAVAKGIYQIDEKIGWYRIWAEIAIFETGRGNIEKCKQIKKEYLSDKNIIDLAQAGYNSLCSFNDDFDFPSNHFFFISPRNFHI